MDIESDGNDKNASERFKNKIYSFVDVAKEKKKSALYLLILIFIIVFLLSIFLNKKPMQENKKTDSEIIEVEENTTALSTWEAQSSDRISNLSQKIDKLMSLSDIQKEQNEKIERKVEYIEKIINESDKKEKNIPINNDSSDKGLSVEQIEKLKEYPNMIFNHDTNYMPIINKNLPKNSIINQDENHQINVSVPNVKQFKKIKLHINTIPKQQSIGMLPMGSFFQAVLLNGLEAGTGQESEANPQPVLMRVVGEAFLPNEYRYRIKSCFVLGSAYASLSSERVYIRTARFSCLSNHGKAMIATNIEGYVVDSDGKIGLRGRLVSRQGAKLGMAMLAGFSSGIASAFNNIQSFSMTNLPNTANLSVSNQSLKQAGLSGFSSASQELAQFYIRQAESIFPVIEVNNGRNVTITLSQALTLHWLSSEGQESIKDDFNTKKNKTPMKNFNSSVTDPFIKINENNFDKVEN